MSVSSCTGSMRAKTAVVPMRAETKDEVLTVNLPPAEASPQVHGAACGMRRGHDPEDFLEGVAR
jgi:hypothetical protein